MNQIIISRPLNSMDVGDLDAAVYVVNTSLSATDFEVVFRKAINDYIVGYMSFDDAVNKALEIHQNTVEGTPEFDETQASFNVEYLKQDAFAVENKIFVHGEHKIRLEHFIDYKNVAPFSIYTLDQWLIQKLAESSTNFSEND